jgi:hypothetical protein
MSLISLEWSKTHLLRPILNNKNNNMEVKLDKLIDDLTQKFWNNNTFSKPAMNARESVLQTIKAYFIKKDLVIVSRVEYERLLKDAQNVKESEYGTPC